METLETLRDAANGKRRRFFNVSLRAATLFKEWLTDWRDATTLAQVLDRWEMGHLLDKHLEVRTRHVGKHIQPEIVRPRAPWDGQSKEPLVNDELLYLVAALLTTSKCERLGVCPYCGICFIATGKPKTYCTGVHGRLAAAKRILNKNYTDTRDKKIEFVDAANREYEQLPKSKREKYEWKKWVADRATDLMLQRRHPLTKNEKRITRNFISYAVKAKDVTPRKGEK